jgi:hypothetical protein
VNQSSTSAISIPAAYLREAPGAKGARICGICSIVFAITFVGFPMAIVLGIVALVFHVKAKQEAHREPGTFRMPTTKSLATGIAGLALSLVAVFVWIGIAGPNFLTQRDDERRSVIISQVNTLKYELNNQAGMMRVDRGRIDPQKVVAEVVQNRQYANPYLNKIVCPEIAEHPSAPGNISIWAGDAGHSTVLPTVTFTVRGSVKCAGATEEIEESVEVFK